MNDLQEEMKKGRERAKIGSFHQAITRAVFHGGMIAFVIWGPWYWWMRLPIARSGMLIYGALASSIRLQKYL